jgi:hypothetical protein
LCKNVCDAIAHLACTYYCDFFHSSKFERENRVID